MGKLPVPEEVSEFLAKANPSVIATVRPDGQPVSVATWYIWESGPVLVNMDEGRKRLEYMRRDPRVSLTVFDADDAAAPSVAASSHVSLQGRVVEFKDDSDLADVTG